MTDATAALVLGFVCGALFATGLLAPWPFRRRRDRMRDHVEEKSNVVQLPLDFHKRRRDREPPRGAA